MTIKRAIALLKAAELQLYMWLHACQDDASQQADAARAYNGLVKARKWLENLSAALGGK